eukprot:511711-Prymnesium_polylepis.1
MHLSAELRAASLRCILEIQYGYVVSSHIVARAEEGARRSSALVKSRRGLARASSASGSAQSYLWS